MSFVRSERTSAILLLIAAIIGLLCANSFIGNNLINIKHSYLDISALNIHISYGHIISDGLLAIFFLLVAIELKHEFLAGSLTKFSLAIRPAIAALGGILFPIIIYILITANSGYENGWPIPTATDIAFALGILAIFGKNLPKKIRVFLLALAVLDDLAGILFIAVFFTENINFIYFGLSILVWLIFWAQSKTFYRLRRNINRPQKKSHPYIIKLLILSMTITGIICWYLVYNSGIHATIAGVMLGFALQLKQGHKVRYLLQPSNNIIIMPLFAFVSALVAIPQIKITDLSPAFWGILIALPVGKIIGIFTAGYIANKKFTKDAKDSYLAADLLLAGALGGIGFTVSLLMNELAFRGNQIVIDEGVIAVLIASAVSIIISVIIITRRTRYYRGLKASKI